MKQLMSSKALGMVKHNRAQWVVHGDVTQFYPHLASSGSAHMRMSGPLSANRG